MNLAPCLFDKLHILRHPGCNAAYWNLHERTLSQVDGDYMVNGAFPLVFFHYSGYRPSAPDQLSGKLRVPQILDQALLGLMEFYRERLLANGAETHQDRPYAFANFSDGSLITLLARRLYSATLDQWGSENPFDVSGKFFKAASKAGILSKQDQSGRFSSNNLPVDDWRIKAINRVIFSLLRVVGADRYTMLMKYLSYISILRNQRQLLLVDEPKAAR
jgi:hypothetical protein